MPTEDGGGAFIIWEPKKQEARNVQRKAFVPQDTYELIQQYTKNLGADDLIYPHSEISMKTMLSRLFKRVGVNVSSHDFRHGKLSDIGKYLTP